jgi:hypothetical protein
VNSYIYIKYSSDLHIEIDRFNSKLVLILDRLVVDSGTQEYQTERRTPPEENTMLHAEH